MTQVWREISLFELANQRRDLFNDGDWIESPYITTSGNRLLQTGNVGVGRLLDRGTRRYVSDDSFAKLKCKEVVPGDILICRLADPAGRACVVPEIGERRMLTSVDVTIFRPDVRKADRRFLVAVFSTPLWFQEVSDRCGGSTRTRIARSELGRIRIRIPDRAEQVRIADAIGDAEGLIATVERLIAKKQAIKQGMMQQLLTGSARLPGFNSPWQTTEVGSLLEFKNGLNKAGRFFGSGTPIVNFMDVMNGPLITASDVAGRVTLTRDEIKRFSARRGDIFFTRTSEMVEEVGTAAALIDDVPDAAFSGFILRGRPRSKDCDSRFLALLFQVDMVRRQITSAATYTTRALTNGRWLSQVVVQIPSLEEQRAISSVLVDSEAEISALKERLKKSLSVKRGMMQELLSGRTRMPMSEAVA